MMQELHPEPVTDHRCYLGEGPMWDAGRGCIRWLDITAGTIHQLQPAGGAHTALRIGQMVGAVAPRQGGGWVAALQAGLGTIDPQTGQTTLLAAPEAHLPGNRFNDGKCDPAGRFWACTLAMDGTRNAGALYVLEGGRVTRKQAHLSVPNGLAWTADGRTMYHIDTPQGQVFAYDFEPDTGNLSNSRTVITFPNGAGLPDGMTIDTEGMLWIGHFGGWQIGRWDPRSGRQLAQVRLPAAHVTSCAFGGENLSDLYITTAQEGLTKTELDDQPLAGCLFVVRDCGFTGYLPHGYAG